MFFGRRINFQYCLEKNVPIISAFFRKIYQVITDSVLRRWIISRLLGRYGDLPSFKIYCPPYLVNFFPLVMEDPICTLPDLHADVPKNLIHLALPGSDLTLMPGETPFKRCYPDIETLLAIHRFAWLPLITKVDPAWVATLWKIWMESYGTSCDGWAWHPYTAAERIINILNFARQYGLPGPRNKTLQILAAHGSAIANKLEYFGDHNTGNHLSNNGRGLYRLGLELGLSHCTEMGAQILLAESNRIFGASGMLREGSSHYHLLLTRNYLDCWLTARRFKRPEQNDFRQIAARTLRAARIFSLPGKMPLIGDISPDCPPFFLKGLLPNGTGGWIDRLRTEDRAAIVDLRDIQVTSDSVATEGWLRFETGNWSGLWYVDPDGWPHIPGHGHQDTGSFELHVNDEPLFVDPGRGAYGETGDAVFYRSALAHNMICINGADPYPPNKPYYSTAFRRTVGGAVPTLTKTQTGVRLYYEGFRHLSGVSAVVREWQFCDKQLTIRDRVNGNHRCRRISRFFHTPHPAIIHGKTAIIQGKYCYRLRGSCKPIIRPTTLWKAYGKGIPGSCIAFDVVQSLPAEMYLTLKIDF